MPLMSTYQLRVRNLEFGGRMLSVLCDHEGNPFPGQRESRLVSSNDCLQEFSVTFIVDGKHTVSDPST